MLGRTLCLNADYRPHKIYDVEDAVWDVMIGKAEQVEGTGKFVHSPSVTVEIPSVVRLYKYVKQPKGTKPRSIPLTPRNVCARDRYRCAYQRPDICLGKATTIDHVRPKAQGGPDDWDNVVAACRKCNHKKGSKTLAELGWELHNKPWRPEGAVARVLLHAHDNRWDHWFVR